MIKTTELYNLLKSIGIQPYVLMQFISENIETNETVLDNSIENIEMCRRRVIVSHAKMLAQGLSFFEEKYEWCGSYPTRYLKLFISENVEANKAVLDVTNQDDMINCQPELGKIRMSLSKLKLLALSL